MRKRLERGEMTDDEINLKQAAEYLPEPYSLQIAPGRIEPLDTDEATAVLEAMLAGSRAGKRVVK